MIYPNKLFLSSDQYRALLDELHELINREDEERRAGNSVKACKYGLEVWDNLHNLMKMLKANSLYELDQHGLTLCDLLYWADCYADELTNASREDESYFQKKLHFYKAFEEMHRGLRDKDVRNLGNIRVSLAESYYSLGEVEKGDSLFRQWLELEPDWAGGWIAWSDCFWLWEFLGLDRDFDKAEKILREGLSVSNASNKDDIQERLQDLLKEKKLSQ